MYSSNLFCFFLAMDECEREGGVGQGDLEMRGRKEGWAEEIWR